MSSFYFLAGMDETADKPYYKLLSLPEPTWEGYTSYGYPGQASTATGQSTPSSAVTVSSSSYTSSRFHTDAYAGLKGTTSAGTVTLTPISSPTSSPVSTGATGTTTNNGNGGTILAAYTSTGSVAGSSGTPATQIAGNLADTGSSSGSSDNFWRHRAQLFEILMVVFASLFGLAVVGGIVMCVLGRRGNNARPSAYRSIHDNESSGTHAPLYGAEGGQSRYADPYHDKE